MLSRGKLVQDWRQRLAAAEEGVGAEPRLAWLYRMRARLYRFLLSCYPDADWRSDETSESPTCDTTTILDVPLEGKPAKSGGRMRAVLKSVTAAQDHPPTPGPLSQGIAEDDWVVAASARDRISLNACQELLRQAGIESVCTLELKVRHFDLERAVELIRLNRKSLNLSAKQMPPWYSPRTAPVPSWPTYISILLLYFAPLYALIGTLMFEALLVAFRVPIFTGVDLLKLFSACYLVGLEVAILQQLVLDRKSRVATSPEVASDGFDEERVDKKA